MQNIREKLRRKLSLHDKNPNLDEDHDPDDVDDETTGNLQREIDRAEREGHPQGKPGSFLNKLIMHGNKKTEDEIARQQALSNQNAASGSGSALRENTNPGSGTTMAAR